MFPYFLVCLDMFHSLAVFAVALRYWRVQWGHRSSSRSHMSHKNCVCLFLSVDLFGDRLLPSLYVSLAAAQIWGSQTQPNNRMHFMSYWFKAAQ